MHRETAERPRARAQFYVGETVKVISGPMSDFSGEIAEINEDAQRRSWSRSSAARRPLKWDTTKSRRFSHFG